MMFGQTAIYKRRRSVPLGLLPFLAGVIVAGRLLAATIPAPIHLRCDCRHDPGAINSTRPLLSWVLPWKGRGQVQSAYQILVATSRALLVPNKANLLDTGRRFTSQSINVPYVADDASPPAAGTRYFWKVRAWNQAGQVSGWSKVNHWREGLLSPADWHAAQWIGIRRPSAPMNLRRSSWIWYPEGSPAQAAPVGTRYFRRNVKLPARRRLVSATATLTADNAFTLWINGHRAASGSNFNTARIAQVTGLFNPGRNVVDVTAVNQGSSPNPAGLIADFHFVFAHGKPLSIRTDAHWQAARQPHRGWKPAMVLGRYGMGPWGRVGGPTAPQPAVYLRREFMLHAPVRRAVAYLCGLGLSKLYINGRLVTHNQLSPALSWYPKRCYYVAQNVTKLLRRGANAVGVTLGNGRMYGMPGYSIQIPPRMIFMLHVRCADGSTAVFTSNTQWKATDHGPIRMNNEYNGETYDARMAMPGWNKLGFDAARWGPAQLVHSPGGRLVAQFQQPIRVTQIIHPVALLHVGKGKWIFDMGQNMVGWCQIKVNGSAGTTIVLRHGEALIRNGHRWMPALGPGKRLIAAEKAHPSGLGLYTANLRSARQTDTLILNGQPITWHPIFTYHGFRYVELTGYRGKPTLSTLEGQEVHDALPVTGGFSCSDPLVNQIYHNCKWGIQDNYRSIPTDCPQRDERQGWMGDRSVESRGEMFIFNNERFYNKWLWDIQNGQKPDGDIADVNPPYWSIYVHDVTWPGTFIMVADNLYLQYGETSPIREHYAAMTRWIDYQMKMVHHGIDPNGGFGDWDPPPHAHSTNIGSRDPNRSTPGPLLATASMYKYLHIMARFARLLHKPADQRRWLADARKLYAGFQTLWNTKGGYYGNGSDTSCLLPLAVGIVPAARQAAVQHRLLWLIRRHQRGHLYCGLIGMQWAFAALSRIHETLLAWAWLKKTTYPSYGYMLKHGATTVWENWNGNTAGPGMNSMNHVMLIGDMVSWLYQDIGGIRTDPATPGFKSIIMRPHLVGNLTWVKCFHRSPYGKIVSDWKITPNHRFLWHIEIPANSSALVEIPTRSAAAVRLDSKPVANRRWIKYVRMADGRAIYRVQSGTYNFSVPLDH